jgi:hypothetical protein
MTVSVKLEGVLSSASGGNQLLIQGVAGRETQTITATITQDGETPVVINVTFAVTEEGVLALSAPSPAGGATLSRSLTVRSVTVPARGSVKVTAEVAAVDEGSSLVTATVIDAAAAAPLCEAKATLMVAPDIVVYAPDGGFYVIPAQAWAQTTPLGTSPATGSLRQLETQDTCAPAYNAVYAEVADVVAKGATTALVRAPRASDVDEVKSTFVACYVLNLANTQASSGLGRA